jgi:hypothetical protein
MRTAQLALAEGELGTEGQYEVEWDVINRPVFSWEGEGGDVKIPPGGSYTVTVRCLGKVGWYVT